MWPQALKGAHLVAPSTLRECMATGNKEETREQGGDGSEHTAQCRWPVASPGRNPAGCHSGALQNW